MKHLWISLGVLALVVAFASPALSADCTDYNVPAGKLKLNEVFSDSTKGGGDWIELKNLDSKEWCLKNLEITLEGGTTWKVERTVKIPARGVVVLGKYKDGFAGLDLITGFVLPNAGKLIFKFKGSTLFSSNFRMPDQHNNLGVSNQLISTCNPPDCLQFGPAGAKEYGSWNKPEAQ